MARRRNNKSDDSKEVEINVKDKDVNLSDLPHIMSKWKKDNDPEWYTRIAPLVDDYASIPFSIPLGTKFNLTSGKSTLTQSYTVPGIMTLKLAPTIGKTTQATDPANVAAQQLYVLTRRANSGRVNYDKTDLMMMVIAMDSAYMLYQECIRAFRLMGVYNYMNRYLPGYTIQALGFSPSLEESYKDMKGLLDLMAYKIGSINVPDEFTFIQRHLWMYSNIYTDANTQKNQMYAFIPDGYYVWTEATTDGQPAYLNYIRRNKLFGLSTAESLVSNLAQIRKAFNTLLDPLLGSEDIGIMSGDLAKAFGDGKMLKMRLVNETDALVPVYSAEVLLQIMNAEPGHGLSYLKDLATGSSFNITQDMTDLNAGPKLVSRPQFNFVKSRDANVEYLVKPYFKHFINYIDIEPTPKLNMVTTRLKWDTDVPTGTGSNIVANVVNSGTEIPVSAYIWTLVDGELATYDYFQHINLNTTFVGGLVEPVIGAFTNQAFDWGPTCFVWTSPTNEAVPSSLDLVSVSQDIQNFTVISKETLAELNNVAVMSEFAAESFNAGIQ